MEVETVGFAEIEKKLKSSLPKAAKKALRKGVSKASQLLAKKAKSRVNRGHGGVPGLLKKSIGQRVKVFKGSGTTVGIVGPRKGFVQVVNGRKVDPVKYAHIEEKGRKVVVARKKKALSDGKRFYGKRVAAYQGRPFLKPTLERDGGAASAAMAQAVDETLMKEAAK